MLRSHSNAKDYVADAKQAKNRPPVLVHVCVKQGPSGPPPGADRCACDSGGLVSSARREYEMNVYRTGMYGRMTSCIACLNKRALLLFLRHHRTSCPGLVGRDNIKGVAIPHWLTLGQK